ncbi:MAG TPA: transglycosylase domain-containing protein [Actinomycetota bacterium]|nr:transglycosylase domain-containing protein [Actinomycetota bacterium]
MGARRKAPSHYGMVNPRTHRPAPAGRRPPPRQAPRGGRPAPRPAYAGQTRGYSYAAARPTTLQAILRRWWLILALAAAGFVLMKVAGLLAEIPMPGAAPGAQSSKLYDARGELIYTFHGTENRTIVPLDAISTELKQAVVAAEDRGFYTHPGVSLKGIVRAAFSNFREGEIGQGASTITQQYARTFATVGKERTYIRKLREATMAVKIERVYSKDKILEFYLNTVYFGRGAYGAEAAAQAYFKKSAKDLDLAESAYLAGIIRSPSRYQMETNPEGVPIIRNRVLVSMSQAGFITPSELQQAQQVDMASRFKLNKLSAELETPRAGYFVEYTRKLLLKQFNIQEKDLLGGGLKIHTTLDLRMQDAAENAVRTTLDRDTDPEVGLVAMDSQGQVKAMVGGRNVDDPKRARGFNFAANLPGDDGGRQAGSAFKPIALAAFVEDGKSIRSAFAGPSKISIDSGLCLNDGKPWEVSNFENASYGNVDLIRATTSSVNTVYAQMMDKVVTPKMFISMAGKLGISIPPVDEGCALTLGTTPVTPMEMARAYATFAARGKRPEPLVVTKIVSPNGETIVEKRPRSEQVISQNIADTVSWILKQNITGGTGTAAKLQWPAMGKTGTAQDHQDASFVGSTPELTAAVWMGFPPDPVTGEIPLMTNVRGKKVTGGSFPAMIWKKFMSDALKLYDKHSDFPSPKVTGEVLSPPAPPCPSAESNVDGSPGEDGEDGEGPESSDPCGRPQASPSPTPTEICGEFPFQPCGGPEEEAQAADDPSRPNNRRNESPRPCPFLRCETPDPAPTAGAQGRQNPPPPPPAPAPTGGPGGLGAPCFPLCANP